MTEKVGDRADVTVIDREPHLTFDPNIPLEVWNDNNPEVSLHLPDLPVTETACEGPPVEIAYAMAHWLDEWWGGDTSILKIGYTPHMLKMGFKEMYCSPGGKIPRRGLPMSEFVADRSPV